MQQANPKMLHVSQASSGEDQRQAFKYQASPRSARAVRFSPCLTEQAELNETTSLNKHKSAATTTLDMEKTPFSTHTPAGRASGDVTPTLPSSDDVTMEEADRKLVAMGYTPVCLLDATGSTNRC
jgi:hypothetical protein